MNVDLTSEMEQLVLQKVKSGRYPSASEVVRQALELLAERDDLLELRKHDLRKKIDEALDSLQRGEGIDGDDFFAQLEHEESKLDRNPQPA